MSLPVKSGSPSTHNTSKLNQSQPERKRISKEEQDEIAALVNKILQYRVEIDKIEKKYNNLN